MILVFLVFLRYSIARLVDNYSQLNLSISRVQTSYSIDNTLYYSEGLLYLSLTESIFKHEESQFVIETMLETMLLYYSTAV